MQGRVQATVVALLGSWVPLLSPATVGLVTLRLGYHQGIWIFIAAILPAVIAPWWSPETPLLMLMVLLNVTSLFTTLVVAEALRWIRSWPVALMLATILSVMAAIVVGLINPQDVENITSAAKEAIEQLNATQQQNVPLPTERFSLGMLGFFNVFVALMGLLIGRWLQSIVYNPGGFQEEIHQLRLPSSMAMVCAGASIYCWWLGSDYSWWTLLFATPLMLSGIGLVHWFCKSKKLPAFWLVAFYAALLLVSPLSILLVLLATSDSFFNVRERLARMRSGE
ncbi:hypothetical protein [Marinibactrum halimedae]|uniref:DUF2232 domain-containing protein n=1 Tax=Marinibactrum halimedae TaxID=1444977 RepID=A0AA37T4D1_9GAMM|nr:hypothetical protein [Marinibactrum halimedae]MCD9458807.1 hypothetical protein [Marinibactrum halimedae]GLS25366.1 hypothetical protein GCM10007877_10800 [Marinibactrum halimedae]